MSALGLLDAELLDLTLAAALFSALAIIEPISAAVAPVQVNQRHAHHPAAPRTVVLTASSSQRLDVTGEVPDVTELCSQAVEN